MFRWSPAAAAAVVLTLASLPAAAQQTRPEAELPGNSDPVNVLTDLPASGNLISLLGSAIADVIADRIDSGGLSPGEAARIGSRGSSWTETSFQLGDVDITDPDGSGTPLMVPGVLEWDRVDVSSEMMPVGVNSPQLGITLTPRRPSKTWSRFIELSGAPQGFVRSADPALAPPIASLRSSASGSLFLSGPIIQNHLSAVLAGTWTKSSIDQAASPPVIEDLTSLFAHAIYSPGNRDEVRAIVWRQRARSPLADRLAFNQPSAFEVDSSLHVQSTWEHHLSRSLDWRAFGGFTRRQRSPELAPTAAAVVDSLTDEPPDQLLYPGPGTDVSWSFGTRAETTAMSDHSFTAGLDVTGGTVRTRPAFGGLIGEYVDGLPARVWDYSTPNADSRWNERRTSAFINDRWRATRHLTIEGGLQFEAIDGSSPTNPQSIAWRNVLPRAGARYELTTAGHLALTANYTRTAERLPLTDLAWGDRNAPTGNVYRWTTGAAGQPPTLSSLGPLVARVGPGGGDAGFSSIDPSLKRPHRDEVVLGLESRPRPSMQFRLSTIASRERDVIGVVDTGVASSSYTIEPIADPGLDLFSAADDQILNAYSRNPSSFGLDRYLLTNPAGDTATLVGTAVTGQATTGKLFVLGGFTASRSEGLAGNVGFQSGENDTGVLGDVFIDPNAGEHAQGRLFTERGYTFKTAAAYRFAGGFRVGVVARYQDGQHFARLVLAPDLTQGPELIRAFRNGRTRFSYVSTVDARLQKDFVLGPYRMTAFVDAYNLLGQSSEVEEYPLTGPLSRQTTAIQPPFAMHVGVRMQF